VKPLRASLLAAARSERLRRSIESVGATRSIVDRFVGGTTTAEVIEVAGRLRAEGLLVTVDHLGEDVHDDAGADATVAAYRDLMPALAAVAGADVSVKLSALGIGHDREGALKRARAIVECASECALTTTIDMESSELTDATLDVVEELRAETPSVAAVLQAMLRRTEADAHRLGERGARVRLCKGAYAERPDVAFTRREEVNASYFRSLRALWDSPGTPLVATHDPTLVAYARELAARAPREFEFQMLYGVRPDEQRALAAAGHEVRVYVPYGDEWYPYLMRRLAERPANVRFFLRAVTTRR
jgi:proline dehydrogenase